MKNVCTPLKYSDVFVITTVTTVTISATNEFSTNIVEVLTYSAFSVAYIVRFSSVLNNVGLFIKTLFIEVSLTCGFVF